MFRRSMAIALGATMFLTVAGAAHAANSNGKGGDNPAIAKGA